MTHCLASLTDHVVMIIIRMIKMIMNIRMIIMIMIIMVIIMTVRLCNAWYLSMMVMKMVIKNHNDND